MQRVLRPSASRQQTSNYSNSGKAVLTGGYTGQSIEYALWRLNTTIAILRCHEPRWVCCRTQGEADWIIHDPNFDFRSLFAQFDTIIVGRKTFEPMIAARRTTIPGIKTVVFSRKLWPENHPDVQIVANGELQVAADLKASAGKDIWLFGGGVLFRSLAEVGLLKTVEVSVMPVLLGAGVPPAPNPTTSINLKLAGHKVYPSGIVSLEYVTRRSSPT